jgi:hypothetical protein
MHATPSLQSDDGPAFSQVFLAPVHGVSLARLQGDGYRPDSGDVSRDKIDQARPYGPDQRIEHRTDILEVPPQVFQDQGIQTFPCEYQLVGREVDHPGFDPEQHGDILVRAAMVSDDYIGALLDEVLPPPELDLLPAKGKPQPALKPWLEALKGSFKIFHQLPAGQIF